jgi:hypothetical protein
MHSVFIDSDYVEASEDADVSVVFPEDFGDEDEPKPDPRSPEAWCNAAGVRVMDDSVQVWISTGDPRGAFVMEIRSGIDGELFIHMPHPGEGFAHEETEELRPGTLLISRTKTSD